LWTEDGIQLPPGSPPIVGKEQIRERNKSALVDLFTMDGSITNEEVQVSGDLAVARGTYATTLTPKDGSEEIFIDGKYMTLLKRQPDGSWKIHRDIFNSNMPPPPAEQAEEVQPTDDVESKLLRLRSTRFGTNTLPVSMLEISIVGSPCGLKTGYSCLPAPLPSSERNRYGQD
jgi:uncharacterized protein (TIGR02246 family)